MTAIELDRVEERTEEPAKGWRNRWRALKPLVTADGLDLDPGDEVDEKPIFPSREVAEQFAANVLERHPPGTAEYVGAFPVSAP